jgi:hypothetical protein
MKVDVAALEQGSVHAGGGTDSVTLGTGVGNALFGGTGANQSLSVAGANATLTDGTGANQTLTATGGNSTFNIENGPSDIIRRREHVDRKRRRP